MTNKSYPLYDVPYTPTFRDLLEFCKSSYSDCIAFSYYRQNVLVQKTYRQFYREVIDLAMTLLSKGYQKCNIAVMGENSYEWILTYLAVVISGNVIVPIDKELPADQVCNILQEIDAKLFVLSDTYKDYAEIVWQSGIHLDVISLQGLIPKWVNLGREESNHTVAMQDYDMVEPSPDDLATIVYTSGTTGTAKGVMLTQRNICANVFGGTRNLHVLDKSMLVLPLHHTYTFTGAVLSTMAWGSTIYICGSLKKLKNDLKQVCPNSMMVVPLMLETFHNNIWKTVKESKKATRLKVAIWISNRMLSMGIDLRHKLFKEIINEFGGNLKQVICGGAALDERYIKEFRSFGIQIVQGYGITECSPMVAVTRNYYYKDASVGLKLPNVEIKIEKFENSQEGEICVKGECVFKGYFNNPELTAEAFDKDGWFKTGDIGYVDEDNFVYITGRKKNMILLSNGKNVYPEELEFEWMKNPAVKEALVYEKDDAITVEILPDAEYFKANPADRDAFFANALADFNHRQPPHKNISQVILRDTPFPKTTSMKIKRNYNN